MNRHIIDGPVTGALVATYVDEAGKKSDIGASSIFLGQIRSDIIEGKRVKEIIYTAYPGMVEEECARIIGDMKTRFPDVRDIAIVHSVGTVKVGENSLLLFVTGGHRDQATKACRETLELVKERLPLWKKEVFEDDSYHWRENE